MNILEYNSIFYKIVKAVISVAEFTKSMLYNCIKVIRLNLTNLTSGYRPVCDVEQFAKNMMNVSCNQILSLNHNTRGGKLSRNL